jgi:hypothetical protein
MYTCMSDEEEDACMSDEEEDTCMSFLFTGVHSTLTYMYTCMSDEEEDTNHVR